MSSNFFTILFIHPNPPPPQKKYPVSASDLHSLYKSQMFNKLLSKVLNIAGERGWKGDQTSLCFKFKIKLAILVSPFQIFSFT